MGNKKSILVVEDESITGIYLELILKRRGFTVYEIATSGEEAVTLAQREKPQIILMDIRLVGDIDGITAAQQIRGFCSCPIIFMTGYSDPKIKDRALKIQNSHYLEKPVNDNELFHTLDSVSGITE